MEDFAIHYIKLYHSLHGTKYFVELCYNPVKREKEDNQYEKHVY